VATVVIIFSENKLTKLANLVQLKRMLMSCLEDWGSWAPVPPFPPPCLRHWSLNWNATETYFGW